VDKHSASLILLTYKGKILLMHRDQSPLIQNPWSFIEAPQEETESFEETILKKVEKETSIKLSEAELLSSEVYENRQKCFYKASLTDNDVNNIMRDEGQTLSFFTFDELENLTLTESAKFFMQKHKKVLENITNLN